MNTLDKYIIKKYLSTFFFACLAFSIISVAIDFPDKVDDFLEESAPLKSIIFDYYINFIPNINGLLWPLFALISVIFFTSRMAANSEIISIFNAGVSYWRLTRPYLMCGVFLAVIHFIGINYIIPNGNKKRVLFENTYVWKYNYDTDNRNIHRFVAPDEKIYMESYVPRDSSCRKFSLEKFKDGKLIYKLKAERADYEKEKKVWEIKNYVIRRIKGMKETLESGKNMELALNIYPKDLERRDNLKETMTTPELYEFVKGERERGAGNYEKFEAEIYNRTAVSFTLIILTLIGMTVASRKMRGGTGIHLVIGVSIGALYILFSRFTSVFTETGFIPPMIGVWIPNIIFTGVVFYLIFRAQK